MRLSASHLQLLLGAFILLEKASRNRALELTGCSHAITASRYVETTCHLKLQAGLHGFSSQVPKQQALIITYTFKSTNALTANTASSYIRVKKCTIRKYENSKDANIQAKVFEINATYWSFLVLINRLKMVIYFNVELRVGTLSVLKRQSKESLINCLGVGSCHVDVDVSKEGLLTDDWSRYNRFISAYGPPMAKFLSLMRVLKEKWPQEQLTVLYFKVQVHAIVSANMILQALQGLDVRKIDFSDCNFEALDAEFGRMLGSFSKLEFLDVSRNQIKRIDSNVFTGSCKLKRLIVCKNNLDRIPDSRFLPSTLESLDVSFNNPLTGRFYLQHEVNASRLLRLETLNLSYVPLGAELKRHVLTSFPSVTTLDIRNCSIRTISNGAFVSLVRLKSLDMSSNPLHVIGVAAFQGLAVLETLRMSNCSLHYRTLRKEHLRHLRGLVELALDENSILSVDFLAGTNATLINMDSNGVKPWSTRYLQDRPKNSTRLLLRHNDVDEVTAEMWDDFQKLNFVNLAFNPFDCGRCEFGDFQAVLLSSSVNDTFVQVDDYVCAIPESANGERLIDHVFRQCPVTDFLVLAIGIVVGFAALFVIVGLALRYRWYVIYAVMVAKSKVRKIQRRSANGGEEYVYDAFVCYSDLDRLWVKDHLIPQMEVRRKPGFRFCVHDRDFLPGATIMDNIIGSISNSRVVLLLVSPGFVESQWCLYETHLAQHRVLEENRNSLILIKMQSMKDVPMPKALTYLMKTRTHLEWPSSTEDHKKVALFWLRLGNILTEGKRSFRLNHLK